MATRIINFLDSFKTNGADYTHTSMNPCGKYKLINPDDITKFYDTLFNSHSKEERYYITEKPNEVSKLRQDFDFRYSHHHQVVNADGKQTIESIYDFESLKKLYLMYCNLLRKTIKINNENNEADWDVYNCVIQLKKPRFEDVGDPSDKQIIKDGIHIIFPNVLCHGWYNDYVSREIGNLIKENNPFNYRHTPHKLNEKFNDIEKLNKFLSQASDKSLLLNVTTCKMMSESKAKEGKYFIAIDYGLCGDTDDVSCAINILNGKEADDECKCLNNNDFSDTISKKGWTMYGTSKGNDYYKNTYIFALDPTNGYDTIITDKTIRDIFPRFFSLHREKTADYYLPLLMSINWVDSTSYINKKNVDTIKYKIRQPLPVKEPRVNEGEGIVIHHPSKQRTEAEILADLTKIRGDIMDMIDVSIADNYNTWMDVGWTLYSISEGHQDFFDLWDNWSQKSNKYKAGECALKWDNMEIRGGYEGRPKTIGSIFKYAKDCNPDAFNEWKQNNVDTIISNSLRCKPTNKVITDIMKTIYPDEYVCARAKGDLWYHYKNGRWTRMDEGHEFKRTISNEINNRFEAYKSTLLKSDVEGSNAKLIKQCDKYKEFIGMSNNINSCLSYSKIEFFKENFLRDLNREQWLIGDANGVYDLKNGIHRNGTPDDMVSLRMGADYREYTYDHPEIKQVLEFYSKVFPDPEILEYFLQTTASCMRAGNVNKKCYIWTNDSGNNGKSVTLKMVEMVFGEYSMNFDRNRFIQTSMKNAGGSSPDLMRIKYKRIGFIKELAENDIIDIGFLKQVTGNDTFFSRGHHEDGEDINPELTLIMMCNKPPKFPSNEKPLWERNRIVPFQSSFVDYAPDDIEEQRKTKTFKADKNFEQKLHKLIPAFYWVFLQAFKRCVANNFIIKEPAIVISETEKYRSDNNIFLHFMCDNIVFDNIDINIGNINSLTNLAVCNNRAKDNGTLYDILENKYINEGLMDNKVYNKVEQFIFKKECKEQYTYCEEIINKLNTITFKVMYERYKMWFNTNYPSGGKIHPFIHFKKEMTSLLKKKVIVYNDSIKGCSLKIEAD